MLYTLISSLPQTIELIARSKRKKKTKRLNIAYSFSSFPRFSIQLKEQEYKIG